MSEKQGELVLPGDHLGVAEEFLPGPGTYELGYRIRAAMVGLVARDHVSKVVSVKPFKILRLPQQGDTVVALVTEVREDFARAKIFAVNNTPLRYVFTGIIHATQVVDKAGEAKQIHEYLRVGDIVRARVLNQSVPYLLTMRDPKLGVILASCSKCGATLRLSGDRLTCPRCGNLEKRKIAQGYGRVLL